VSRALHHDGYHREAHSGRPRRGAERNRETRLHEPSLRRQGEPARHRRQWVHPRHHHCNLPHFGSSRCSVCHGRQAALRLLRRVRNQRHHMAVSESSAHVGRVASVRERRGLRCANSTCTRGSSLVLPNCTRSTPGDNGSVTGCPSASMARIRPIGLPSRPSMAISTVALLPARPQCTLTARSRSAEWRARHTRRAHMARSSGRPVDRSNRRGSAQCRRRRARRAAAR
jgi:hypothetical protein